MDQRGIVCVIRVASRAELGGAYGDCTYGEPSTIRIRRGLKLRPLVDTLCHELLHLLFPQAPESWVLAKGTECADLIMEDVAGG